MKSKITLIFLVIFSLSLFGFKRSFVTGTDVFGTRVFVENKGQFKPYNGEQIQFAYQTGSENISFTKSGLIYRLVKKFPMSHEQRERLEHGKSFVAKPDEVHYVQMKWLNCNPGVQIIEEEKQDHYFTYGAPDLNSYGYKKITYKNIYYNIDIEYVIPKDKEHGIKYNVILHPGANINDLKISYIGDVDKIKLKSGNVIVKTPLEDITEHTPLSFYESGEKLPVNFKLENDIISFDFPNGYDNTKKVTIDPWVTTLTTLLATNHAYDVDYDYLGNLFVYGGLTEVKVAKYSPGGALIWTFNGNLPLVPWNSDGDITCVGNFIVNKITGKTYIGTGFEFNGARVVRLDPAGNYDNFVTNPINTWREIWDMGFHCGTGKVYGLGGGTFGNTMAGLIDQITASVTPANFSGSPASGQDIISNAIDDVGDIYIYYVIGGTQNKIIRVNNGFNGNVWLQPSTYTSFTEAQNKTAYVGLNLPGGSSNGFNCLAVNSSFLYFYDGFNLAAYDKNTGIKLGFTTIPALTLKAQGGIAVDDCNNVYLGGNGNILSYNYNNGVFNALPSIPLNVVTPNQYVYDVKLDRNANVLYVSGSGFAGTFSAINSLTCGIANQFAINSSCAGINNGTGVATLTTAVPNPTINYIWINGGNTVSATYSTGALTNTVTGLPNGTYTVLIQLNGPCGPVYANTVNIGCCAPFVVTPNVTQTGCTNTVNAVSLNITGGGTVVPSVTWSPVPGAVAGNSLSATGLPIGTTTITTSFGLGCTSILTVNILPTPPPVTFTVNNLTGSYSVTCINPTINLQAVSNYTYGSLSYSWTSITFTANTPTVGISNTNTLNITVTDPITGCSQTQTVAIDVNTVAPTSSVNPTNQSITCSSLSAATFSGSVISPTVNYIQSWYSPINPPPAGPPVQTCGTPVCPYNVTSPGVYTVIACNTTNGCCTAKTVTVTSLSAFPTYSLNSPTNYSIGCAPLNQTTISIVNPVSTQTPPATCSFTFLPPGFSGTVGPGPFGLNTSTTTQVPGTWTVIVVDNSNNCQVAVPVPILQNTVAPNVSANMLTHTLTCKNPTVVATGTSSTANTNITWIVPSTPPNLSTPTVVIGDLANGPNTSSTSLTYANFTVVAQNSLNACISTSVVTINQNFKPPVSTPTISIGTPTAIYCTVSNAPVVLTTGNSTTTSGGGALAFPVVHLWQGPIPQPTVTGASSYSCYIAGIYSLSIMDNYNGCVTIGTINVVDRSQPPVINEPIATGTLDCGADQATLFAAITGSTSNLKYWYYEYPLGASFSPTNATTINANQLLCGTNSQTVTVSMSGTYKYVITNTVTGCRAFGTFNVGDGGIIADFTADPQQGYPPLDVTFTNNSSTTLGSSSITSVWGFGNGTSYTTSANVKPSTTYNAPGTYTVMLVTSKGTCLDTVYKIVQVDMPSKLEPPNIFTPNGDGNNDVFILKAASIGEIHIFIHDRWGNKVYETTSSTGNIAWDGVGLNGKTCSDGVYFYVLRAKGKDGKDFNLKGNVTLLR